MKILLTFLMASVLCAGCSNAPEGKYTIWQERGYWEVDSFTQRDGFIEFDTIDGRHGAASGEVRVVINAHPKNR